MSTVAIACAARGMIGPGAMCGHVIVGSKDCGFSGQCEHQRPKPPVAEVDPRSDFRCPVCGSHYFSAIFEKSQHVGRYCKGWPTGYDRSYNACRGKHEERFIRSGGGA